jgi:hypothetical protein
MYCTIISCRRDKKSYLLSVTATTVQCTCTSFFRNKNIFHTEMDKVPPPFENFQYAFRHSPGINYSVTQVSDEAISNCMVLRFLLALKFQN